MAEPLPVEAQQAIDQYNSLVAQKASLSGQLGAMQEQGILWNDPRYQSVQQQYTAVEWQIAPAYEAQKAAQNQALGIIGGVSQGSGELGVSKTFGTAASPYQGGGAGNAQGLSSPTQIQTLPSNLPMANVYNQQVVALNAARQEGATSQSVQSSVSNYNLYSSREYNPVNPNGTLNRLYVPEGNFIQQELSNVKLGGALNAKGQSTGEYAIYKELPKGFNGETRYTIDPTTGQLTSFMLIGGGGRNALQSGTVGFAAATPAVYKEGRVGQGEFTRAEVVAPGVATSGMSYEQVVSAVEAGTAGSLYSRLGSEAYGGIVTRLDGRTLGNVTYEDVSSRASWNLASYVNPTDVNMSKADLPGVNIPWGVASTAPAMFALSTAGGVGAPIEVKSFTAYVGGEANVAKAPATTLIIGGVEGARYGPSIVASDRLAGGGKVASVATVESNLPAPFVSGTIQKPTGEIFGYKIPIISDFIAMTSPSVFVSGRATSVSTQTTTEKTAGPDYATPSTREIYTFTGVSQKSEYDKMLDSNLRAYIPTPEVGEAGLRVASATNPITAGYTLPAVFSEKLTGKETALSYFEPLKGHYALFYERPETALTSYAIGGAFGLGTRGLSAVASRSVTLAEIAPAVSRFGGAALGAVYAGVVTYESTGGLRDFAPENIAQIRSRAVQEAYPMALGFGAGYAVPERISPIVEPTISRVRIEYPQFVEESGSLRGTGRYLAYKAEPITSVVTEPITRGKLEYPQFVEESGGSRLKGTVEYGKYIVESAYSKYIEIPTKSFVQEIVPVMAGEIPGRTVPIDTVGKIGKPPQGGTPSPISRGGFPGEGSTPSRITTRIVGGKETSSLVREPSLQSRGISEPVVRSSQPSSVSIGQRSDFRNLPRTTEAPYRKMQMQTSIMSEQLPVVEGMTQGRIQPLPQQQRSGLISVVEPDLALSRERLVALVSTTAIKSELRQSSALEEVMGLAPTSSIKLAASLATEQMKEVASGARSVEVERGAELTTRNAVTPIREPTSDIWQGSSTRSSIDIGQPQITTPTTKITTSITEVPPPQPPTEIPGPQLPKIPGAMWLPGSGGGGGGGGGYKKPYRNLKTEIFSYAPKNLDAIFGRRKSRRK